MEVQIDPRKGNSNFLHTPIKEIQRCHQCDSVFIDNGECETCGYQLNFDFLGDPLGEKSFYSIRESYWENLGPLTRLHGDLEHFDPLNFSRYKRKMFMRYNILLDYFYNRSEYRVEDRNLYLQEFTDLIIELIKYGVSEDELWKNVDESSKLHSIYAKIHESIECAKLEKENSPSLVLSLLDYRVFGLMRVGVIAITFFGGLGLVAAALSFYRYMLFNY
ncbi:hypothetical protein [Halobacteriovorax sp. JY17]|uniref:hypothetical protein n=1 Tax=Halobacteriovorax sp. JY17 TaxID=2014617 RepID=UPI000C40685F|nr:hypothetical protein [Halobacteriovorax sp. JY17]PIK14962.1 MAG: hypothetical protein CES88_11555 [Halobacteriovorax sp. JY17]